MDTIIRKSTIVSAGETYQAHIVSTRANSSIASPSLFDSERRICDSANI